LGWFIDGFSFYILVKDNATRMFKVINRVVGRVEKHKEKLGPRRPKKKPLPLVKKVPCRICGKLCSSQANFLEHFQEHRKNPGMFFTQQAALRETGTVLYSTLSVKKCCHSLNKVFHKKQSIKNLHPQIFPQK